MLPGVPREMRGMCGDTIVPLLSERVARGWSVAVLEGDREAFRAVLESVQKLVYNIAWRLTWNATDAEGEGEGQDGRQTFGHRGHGEGHRQRRC